MKEFKKGKELLYLSIKDVEDVNFSMEEVIDVLEIAFTEKGNERFEKPPKIGIHTKKDAFIHAMPCWIPKFKSCGIKWVSGYPESPKLGYQYITGLLMLNSTETGVPLSVMDCRWITAMRTGGISGLAAKYLARPDSELIGILGCGQQAKTSLEAILVTCPNIKKVLGFDIIPENAKKFAEEMGAKFNLEIIPVVTQKEAVVDSDIIVTAGALVENRVVEAEWFKEGAFGCPVDIDVMWKAEALQIADKYYVDDIDQHKYFQGLGYCKDVPKIYGDLGGLITKKVKGRENDHERIISLNIGLALDDIAVAHKIYDKALKNNIGSILPL